LDRQLRWREEPILVLPLHLDTVSTADCWTGDVFADQCLEQKRQQLAKRVVPGFILISPPDMHWVHAICSATQRIPYLSSVR